MHERVVFSHLRTNGCPLGTISPSLRMHILKEAQDRVIYLVNFRNLILKINYRVLNIHCLFVVVGLFFFSKRVYPLAANNYVEVTLS